VAYRFHPIDHKDCAIMTTAVTSKPDVHDMVVVHRSFRQACAELPELLRGLAPGETARAALIVEAVHFMLTGLETHHTSEDEYLWPMLKSRAVEHADAITHMESQHERLEELVEQVKHALEGLADDPEQARCEKAAQQITELDAVLIAHMDEEESTVLPLVIDHLTVDEWEKLGQVSLAKMEKKDLLRAFSALMAVANPEEQHTILTKAPLPARVMWRLIGRRSYARSQARLRGASH
jgi:hemerythrin-like domain-containing protein